MVPQFLCGAAGLLAFFSRYGLALDRLVAEENRVYSREDLLRIQAVTALSIEIVHILRRQTGKHTEEDLMALVEKGIRDKKMPWHEDDYRMTIFNMTVSGTIIVDGKDEIWLATRPPWHGLQKKGDSK